MYDSNLTDYQVMTLVRAYPGMNVYQLTCIAKREMSRWQWTCGKVQHAVERLQKAGRVDTKLVLNGGRACREVYLKTV